MCLPSAKAGAGQQEQAIHQKDSPSTPIVRHRAAPYERDAVDIYGTRARKNARGAGGLHRRTVMKKLPSAADGPAPAQSIAYPEDYAIPDNPFDPPPEAPRPPRRTRSARPSRLSKPQRVPGGPNRTEPLRPRKPGWPAATTVNAPGTGARIAVPADSPVMVTEDGSRYEPPARPDMPEWLPRGTAEQFAAAPPRRPARTGRAALPRGTRAYGSAGPAPAPPHARAAPPLRPASPDHGGLRAGGLSPVSCFRSSCQLERPAGRAARAPAARRAVCREPATRSRQKRERSSARLHAGPIRRTVPNGNGARPRSSRAHTGDGAARAPGGPGAGLCRRRPV